MLPSTIIFGVLWTFSNYSLFSYFFQIQHHFSIVFGVLCTFYRFSCFPLGLPPYWKVWPKFTQEEDVKIINFWLFSKFDFVFVRSLLEWRWIALKYWHKSSLSEMNCWRMIEYSCWEHQLDWTEFVWIEKVTTFIVVTLMIENWSKTWKHPCGCLFNLPVCVCI